MSDNLFHPVASMIQPYQTENEQAVLDAFDKCVPDYFAPKEKNDLKDYLDKKGDTYHCIVIEGKVVGGVGYFEENTIGKITWIFLTPDYMGKGLGRMMVEHSQTNLKKNRKVNTFKVSTSQLAFQFFEKLGYHTTKVVENYWAEGYNLYEMEMPNTSSTLS